MQTLNCKMNCPIKLSDLHIQMPNDIDVWYAHTKAFTSMSETLAAFLSEGELSRARSYKFEAHRRRYILRRGLLRILLAAYLGEHPGKIAIQATPTGKPGIGSAPTGHLIEFSL